ncbi:MT-A70 family methyltransferase [Oceanimonas pelagia]|uniref:MT-A70 family methyltransferase n=1 Tax=Oceanimonas pelagia TaxID=3028314 RepID=A0AA50KPP2_9GAMM|nr:MT-A70 family methyltransferase [Oceanimonas pelagia]WMC11715.1 MT-A70 family methyltransferase [Oceanimonas pelagia]
MKYTLIYADPPWQYRDKCNSGERGAHFKYPVMNLTDICRLPVHTLAAESCLLAMWHVPTMPAEALKVIDAWGFRLMTMKGFTWGKTYKNKTDKHAIGMGHMTRANSEDMLFAVKGKLPPRVNAGICQLQIYPRMEHSAKPPEFRDHLVDLLGDVPRIELFARDSAPGWDHWGNELKSETSLIPGGFLKGKWVAKPDSLKPDRREIDRLVNIVKGSNTACKDPI